jgi:hypothetical protein
MYCQDYSQPALRTHTFQHHKDCDKGGTAQKLGPVESFYCGFGLVHFWPCGMVEIDLTKEDRRLTTRVAAVGWFVK